MGVDGHSSSGSPLSAIRCPPFLDEQAIIDVMSGQRRGVTAGLARLGLSILSGGYGAAVALRNWRYDAGWGVRRVSVPVISIGNLTTGGTGKTPVVAWFVRQLIEQGRRPGIVSRGYRSLESGENDEARVLALACPATPHVQNRDRVVGAQQAIREFGCDAIVLDDAFQHRRLARDLDVVLIDATQPWGYGHLLPRGLLREPLAALRRADLVLITRADLVAENDLVAIRSVLRKYRGSDSCALVRFAPTRWVNVHGETRSLEFLSGSKAAAFCGIGNPVAFRQTLESVTTVDELKAYPDHHHYSLRDLDELERWRQSRGVGCLLTTVKDLVKIPPGAPIAEHTWAIDIGVDWLSGGEDVVATLTPLCEGCQPPECP